MEIPEDLSLNRTMFKHLEQINLLQDDYTQYQYIDVFLRESRHHRTEEKESTAFPRLGRWNPLEVAWNAHGSSEAVRSPAKSFILRETIYIEWAYSQYAHTYIYIYNIHSYISGYDIILIIVIFELNDAIFN